MTDKNQTSSTENSGETTTEPKFGEGETQKPEAKFGTEDVTKLMKMNKDAQSFIDQLKTETSTLRSEVQKMQEELAKARTIDDLINTQQRYDDSDLPESKTPQLDKNELLAELEQRVFNNMTKKQQEAAEQDNWNKSLSMAKERFGDKFTDYVTDRAKELDISVKEMEQYAKTSPKAFMQLLDTKKSPVSPTLTQSQAPAFNTDIDAQFEKVATLRRQDTPEGREANRLWIDPEFQKKYREHILNKNR